MGGWQGEIPLYLAALGRILAQFSPAAPGFACGALLYPLSHALARGRPARRGGDGGAP